MYTEMAVIGGIVVRLIVVAMYVVIWVMMMNVNDYPDLHLAKQDLKIIVDPNVLIKIKLVSKDVSPLDIDKFSIILIGF
jgi:hypothetical protein